MNEVEIEAASSELALQPFDAVEFPFMYLAAFGIKDTTLKRPSPQPSPRKRGEGANARHGEAT